MPPKKRKPPTSPPRAPTLELRGGTTTGTGGWGRGRRGHQQQQHQQHQQAPGGQQAQRGGGSTATGFHDAHHRPIRTRGAPAAAASSSSNCSAAAEAGGGGGGGAGKRARTTGTGARAGAAASASSSSSSSSVAASRAHHAHQQGRGQGYGHGHHHGGGGGGRLSHTSYQLGSPAVAALRLVPIPDPVLQRLRAALPFTTCKGFPPRRLTCRPALLTTATDGLAQYLPQPAPPYTLAQAPGGAAPACLRRRREGDEGMQRDWLLVPSDLRTCWLLRRAAAGGAGAEEAVATEKRGLVAALRTQEEGEAPLHLDLRRLLQPPGAPAPILIMPDPTLEDGGMAEAGPALCGWLEGEGAALLATEAGTATQAPPLLPCACAPGGFPMSHAGFAPRALERTVLGFAASAAAAVERGGEEQEQAPLWRTLAAEAYRDAAAGAADEEALARLREGPVALRLIDWEEMEDGAAGAKTKAGLLALEGPTALVAALLRGTMVEGAGLSCAATTAEEEDEADEAGQMQRLCAEAATALPLAAAAFPLSTSTRGGAALAAWALVGGGGGKEEGEDAMEVCGDAPAPTGAGQLLADLAPDPGDDAVFPPPIPNYAPIPEHAAPGPVVAPLLLLRAGEDGDETGVLAAWGLRLVGGDAAAAAEGAVEQGPLPARALGPAPPFVVVSRGRNSSSGQRTSATPASLLLLGGPEPPASGDCHHRFLPLPPPPPSYPPPPAARPSMGAALAALLPRLLALLGDAAAADRARRAKRPLPAALAAAAKASPVPASRATRPLHWHRGPAVPRRKPWEEEEAGAVGGGMGPLPDCFRLSDLNDPVGHDLALMLFFSCDDPAFEAMQDWWEDRRAPRPASPMQERQQQQKQHRMEEGAGEEVALAPAGTTKRRAAAAVGAPGGQLRVTVSGKATSKGDSLADVFAGASPAPTPAAASKKKKPERQQGAEEGNEDDLFTSPSPAASSPLAASPAPPRTQARVLMQLGATTTVAAAGSAGASKGKGKGSSGGMSSDTQQSPGADALLDDFFQLRKPPPPPSARRGGGGPPRDAAGPRAAPTAATSAAAGAGRPMAPNGSVAAAPIASARPSSTGAAAAPAFPAATCLMAERLLDLGEDELIQGMAREFNVTLVDAPLDEDVDMLLDERTGVKLLGLDAVVEDPATDPAFESYKTTIRRLLSLSTKLETLYLLLVPGGDPLQHRAAIRAIKNAVLNCSRMEVVVRVVSEGNPASLRRLLRAAVDATLARRAQRKTASDDAWLKRAGASLELLDQAAFLAAFPTLNYWAALLMVHQLPLRQLLAAPAPALHTAFPTLPKPWLHDFAALTALDLAQPAAQRMLALLQQEGEEDDEKDPRWQPRGGRAGYNDPPLLGAAADAPPPYGGGGGGGGGRFMTMGPPSPPRFHDARDDGGGGGARGLGTGGSEWGQTDYSPSPTPSPPPLQPPPPSRQQRRPQQPPQQQEEGGFYRHPVAAAAAPPSAPLRRGEGTGADYHHHYYPEQQFQQQEPPPPEPPRRSYQQLGRGLAPPPPPQQHPPQPLQSQRHEGGSRLKPARVGLDYSGAVVGVGGQTRLRFVPK